MFETNCIFEYKPSPHFRLDVVYKMGGRGHYGNRNYQGIEISASSRLTSARKKGYTKSNSI